MREKRRTPRVPLSCKVKVETVRGTFHTQGRDLSDGGIGVYLTKLPPIGSPVTVRFQLPGLEAHIEVTGEVKYHNRGQPGMGDDWIGVRFLRMDAPSQTAIHQYVKVNFDPDHQFGPPPPPPLPKKGP
jgi:uncharacterized protein (TIGR02266 family)